MAGRMGRLEDDNLPATQIERPFRIKTTLGEDALLLNSFTGDERVSTPFRFILELLSANPNIDMKGLLRSRRCCRSSWTTRRNAISTACSAAWR